MMMEEHSPSDPNNADGAHKKPIGESGYCGSLSPIGASAQAIGQTTASGSSLAASLSSSSSVNVSDADFMVEICRKVVGRSLRLRGMLEVLSRLRTLCQNTVDKACLALLMPRQYAQIVS